MWQLVKAELKYYRIAFSALIFLTILSQIIEFFVLKTMLEMEGKIVTPQMNEWNSNFSFLLAFSFFLIWQNRIKEKRERHLLLLPLSCKELSISRFWFMLLPFLIIISYFSLLNLVTNSIWQIELTIPIAELGIMFSLLASYVFIRDKKFSYWDLGEKIGYLFFYGILVLTPLFILFHTIQIKHQSILPIMGLPFDSIQYFLLGLVIMYSTIFSYQKRKSFF